MTTHIKIGEDYYRKEDYTNALIYFDMAIEKQDEYSGDALAMKAHMFEHGFGVVIDLKRANRLYEMSRKLGTTYTEIRNVNGIYYELFNKLYNDFICGKKVPSKVITPIIINDASKLTIIHMSYKLNDIYVNYY
jgi:TPR repeat protein